MKATDIKKKLEVVFTTFQPAPTVKKTDIVIDNQLIRNDTRAWVIADSYLFKDRQPTKKDLRYINQVVNKLVSIIGTDETKITKDYILANIKLNIHTDDEWDKWIDSYKQLIKLIK